MPTAWPPTACFALGTDRVDELMQAVPRKCSGNFRTASSSPASSSSRNENWLTRLLHNQTALALQRRLHLDGMQMVILPMQL